MAGGGEVVALVAGEILRVLLDEAGAIGGVVLLAHGQQADKRCRHPADHSRGEGRLTLTRRRSECKRRWPWSAAGTVFACGQPIKKSAQGRSFLTRGIEVISPLSFTSLRCTLIANVSR